MQQKKNPFILPGKLNIDDFRFVKMRRSDTIYICLPTSQHHALSAQAGWESSKQCSLGLPPLSRRDRIYRRCQCMFIMFKQDHLIHPHLKYQINNVLFRISKYLTLECNNIVCSWNYSHFCHYLQDPPYMQLCVPSQPWFSRVKLNEYMCGRGSNTLEGSMPSTTCHPFEGMWNNSFPG